MVLTTKLEQDPKKADLGKTLFSHIFLVMVCKVSIAIQVMYSPDQKIYQNIVEKKMSEVVNICISPC